jgi:hypothetical protein
MTCVMTDQFAPRQESLSEQHFDIDERGRVRIDKAAIASLIQNQRPSAKNEWVKITHLPSR